MSYDPDHDPTLMRNQASLTQSTSTIWIVVGTIIAAVSGVVLGALVARGSTVALVGLIAVASLYLALLIARVTISAGRRRLRVLAGLLIALAAVALLTTVIDAMIAGRELLGA